MLSKKLLSAVISLLIAALLSMSSICVFADDSIIPVEVVNIDEQIDEVTDGEQTITYNAGDINGDQKIDINDVTDYQLTLAGMLEATPYYHKNGDTNVNGKKNIDDVTVIQLYVAKVFRQLPVTEDNYYAHIYQP